ncbi:hypothetical protein QCA50_018265 [Cerrena zonata]|uniref:C2H2-type domain-containing protein n=1 Tax=Cerrena zonata TaxID=2478898 RepID=A0AAW0FBA5_9APHY
MSDVNLATHFRGISGNNRCPECHKNHHSLTELKEHLWVHREADAGEPISQVNRRRKCPHSNCVGKIFAKSTPINAHLLTHTGGKPFVCPHLSAWGEGQRKLCGYASAQEHYISDHRRRIHKYNDKLQTTDHPWVDEEDTLLSAAELHFGNPQLEVENIDIKQEAGAEWINADDNQPDQPPPVQPPAPAPVNEGPVAAEDGANVQAQVAVPVPPRVRRHHARPPVPVAHPRRPIHLDPPNQFISRTATTPRRRLHPMLVIPPTPQYVYVPYVRRVSTGVRYDPYRRGMVEDFDYEHILMRMARD